MGGHLLELLLLHSNAFMRSFCYCFANVGLSIRIIYDLIKLAPILQVIPHLSHLLDMFGNLVFLPVTVLVQKSNNLQKS